MVKYEITKHVATIAQADDGCSLELNLIRWNGRAEKYDIRRWTTTPNGDRVMLKGISFSQGEFEMLRKILDDIDKGE